MRAANVLARSNVHTRAADVLVPSCGGGTNALLTCHASRLERTHADQWSGFHDGLDLLKGRSLCSPTRCICFRHVRGPPYVLWIASTRAHSIAAHYYSARI
jgi:hypothetical protein